MTSQVAMITREEILARLNDPSLLLVNVMPKEDICGWAYPTLAQLAAV